MSDKLINPFCVVTNVDKPFGPGETRVPRVTGSEYDQETGAVLPIIEMVDIEEEIQACRNMCGVELMRTLLSQGKAKPEDFYDDGNSGIDVSLIPGSVHEAAKAAEAGQQQFAELAKALGIEDGEALTAQQLEKALTAYISKAVSEQTKAVPVSEVSSNE